METFIKQITREAGDAILKIFGKTGVKYTKENATDVVTDADLVSNKIIMDAIKKKYPSHVIISEETGGHQNGSKYCWIIDPLDGTRNFSTKIPMFGVLVGFAINGKMKMATIYNPCTNELIFAKKGKGAFLNGKKIYCSKHKTWADSYGLASVNMCGNKNSLIMRKLLKNSKKEKIWLSMIGSSAISTIYLADGRRDWRVSIGGGLWDYASPSLILKESGCIVTNFKGEPWSIKDREIVAGNKYLQPKLLKIINS